LTAVAVNHINFEIAEGEFFTLLGSSGWARRPRVRMVGGLEKPRRRREIHLGDKCLVSESKRLFVSLKARIWGWSSSPTPCGRTLTVFENVVIP
jgi:ABC-type Fe3+/spermidine/putrescine transport system ATPase subunit